MVWRDLDLARDRSFLKSLLKALPLSSLEAVSVPLRELHGWLGDRHAIRLGTEVDTQSAEDIGVGATVVVPTEYGGIGGHGTFDGSADRVSDVSSAAMRDHRGFQFQFHDAPPVHDKRTEPWVEWLSLMGISTLVSVPEARWGRLVTRSTAVYGQRWESKQFRWPLWHVALVWPDVSAALAGTRFSFPDALWCEAPRLSFGTGQNRTYGLGAGSPRWM